MGAVCSVLTVAAALPPAGAGYAREVDHTSFDRLLHVGAKLHELLDDQARRFLRERPERNHIDIESRVVTRSRIFDWYGADFGHSPAEIGAWLSRCFDGAERQLLLSGEFRMRFSDYDGSLNLQAR